MPEPLLTPSKITAWLDCPHYLTLRDQVDRGEVDEPDFRFGAFAQLLADKGLQHEADCLADYRTQGKSIHLVPDRYERESFAGWVKRIGNPLADEHDVIYQMPFVHCRIRGIADFLVRVQDPESGVVSYEPVDAKLARAQAKPGHLLQLCFYADAIEALTDVRPANMHIWLGSGHVETFRVNDFGAYWRRLRAQLRAALEAGPAAGTVPRRCQHCQFCEFTDICETRWREEDSLIYVAGIRQPDVDALTAAGVSTLTALPDAAAPVAGLRPERQARLSTQARLQVAAPAEGAPPFVAIVDGRGDSDWGKGLHKLPAPDDGDVFLDFEGHPFWRADTGLFFLFGLIERATDGGWEYRAWWAHDREEEATAVAGLIDYLAARRVQNPGMHVYHYNHTERTSLVSLTTEHRVREAELTELITQGTFVDLYLVSRNSFQVGVESYGLKHLEQLTDFERSHEIDKGAGAVVQYEKYMADGNRSDLTDIARYNEDDVRATMALRDWLIAQRPTELPWFVPEPDDDAFEPDEKIARLHEFGPVSTEYLLGDLLGYWGREWLAYIVPKMVKLESDPLDFVDDPEVLAELEYVGLVERTGANGRAVRPAMRFTFPHQVLDRFPTTGGSVFVVTPDGHRLTLAILQLDRRARIVEFVQSKAIEEDGFIPSTAVMNDWVAAKPKPDVLADFAERWLDGKAAGTVTASLLRRDLPRFIDGGGPANGMFTDRLEDMTAWVTELDSSVVGIQGPPGAGKTYSAAHLVYALIKAGKRVGITATSHAATINVVRAVVNAFEQSGDEGLLRGVYKPANGFREQITGITVSTDSNACASDEFNLVAGTTWLFCSAAMREAPVDVLLIDEAGQMSLADAAAASCAAGNLILLGDPLQLPQVAQASHPGDSGKSVLEFLLGEATTMPTDRGVFLSTTYRMHTDVCQFISEQIYQSRLGTAESCARQATAAGTGLRWLRADHSGRSTSSPEEADVVAEQITALIGTPWTNQKGEQKPLTTADFMVVAPYNDQVRTIKERLAREPSTIGVRVGTVDKFQGGEAAVVLFSMTTSSGEDMTRGADFLFSRNRLNVAISRARCLAYLICTDELLNARARTVDEMRLIGTLNAFVEQATASRPDQ